MNLLLDTHALLRWLADTRLGDDARSAIADPHNHVVVSAVSLWEIAIKRAHGKLTVEGDLDAAIADSGFDELPIRWHHALAAGELEPIHRDPFDRMLVAQSRTDGLTVVTRDPAIGRYGVPTIAA